MSVGGISSISSALELLNSIIREANEPPYITQQKAARGDSEAIRRLAEEHDDEELMARLIRGSSQEGIGENLDLFA